MATILLTGVTGTIGSALAPCLKARGHRLICLVRHSRNQTSEERVRHIFGEALDGDIIWDGDVTLPLAGVCDSERNRWRGEIDIILHCASSISFDETDGDTTTFVNVVGTETILSLAKDLRIREVHYVSTAYVAGDADFLGERDLNVGQTPRNTYERTKKQAEQIIGRWPQNSIYRLGIVVGDSTTGYTPKFTGYYRPFAFFHLLRQHLHRKLVGDVVQKYHNAGIIFNGGDNLILPIRINCSPISTLNLVPRDWLAETLTKLVSVPASGTTFHLVHPAPMRIMEITDTSLRLLGITGYRYGSFNGNGEEPRSILGRLQEGFDRNTKAYLPYIRHEARFECGNVEKALGSDFIPPPDMNKDLFAVLLNYAKSVSFGKPEQSLQAVEA